MPNKYGYRSYERIALTSQGRRKAQKRYAPKGRYGRAQRYKESYKPMIYTSLKAQGTPSGLPTIKIANLRYVENVSITSTLGAIQRYSFRANSIFDPNFTGIGHQPMGRDIWAQLYNNYVVLGSKITAKFTTTTSAGQNAAVGVMLDDNASLSYSDYSGYVEARKGSNRMMIGREAKPITVVSKFSAKRFFNVVDVKDNIDDLGAVIGNNPNNGAFFNVYYQDLTGSTSTINVSVCIDYIVSFSEPHDIAQS